VLTPLYTPGSLTVLVPVTDHGVPHVAAILGATEIPRSPTMKNAYVASAKHLGEVAAKAKVDVELNSRPFVDNAIQRMDSLRKAPAMANPFVIGTEKFQSFVGMLGECAWVSILRPREVE
jgi:metallo-beta-lactamase class B